MASSRPTMASSRSADEENQQKKNPFPKTFYDPNTNKLFTHPVVGPDGISVEKREDQDASVFYPNRALEDLIEEQTEKVAMAGSIRGTLLEWKESMRSMRIQLLEKSAIPSPEYQPLPEALYCPISFELMHQPVIGPDGTTFEKAAILHWLASNDHSPISRSPLKAEQLYDNLAILEIIEDLTTAEDTNMHQSIRNWKEVHSTRLKQSAAEVAALNAVQEETNTQPSAYTQATQLGRDEAIRSEVRRFARNEAELRRLQRQRRLKAQFTTCALFLSIFILVLAMVLGISELFFFALAFVFLCEPLTSRRGANNQGGY